MPCTVTDDELFHSPPKFPKFFPGRFCFPNTTSCTNMETFPQPDSDDNIDEMDSSEGCHTLTPL
jgi:hypothetical protein